MGPNDAAMPYIDLVLGLHSFPPVLLPDGCTRVGRKRLGRLLFFLLLITNGVDTYRYRYIYI